MADNNRNLQPQLSLGHEIHSDDSVHMWSLCSSFADRYGIVILSHYLISFIPFISLRRLKHPILSCPRPATWSRHSVIVRKSLHRRPMESFQHGDTKISNAFWIVLTIWLIYLSLWNCFSFVCQRVLMIVEDLWQLLGCLCDWFWLDFDHFLSLMQAAAVKQEIKEELLQEIGRWLSDCFGTGRPFGSRSIPTCFLKN